VAGRKGKRGGKKREKRGGEKIQKRQRIYPEQGGGKRRGGRKRKKKKWGEPEKNRHTLQGEGQEVVLLSKVKKMGCNF